MRPARAEGCSAFPPVSGNARSDWRLKAPHARALSAETHNDIPAKTRRLSSAPIAPSPHTAVRARALTVPRMLLAFCIDLPAHNTWLASHIARMTNVSCLSGQHGRLRVSASPLVLLTPAQFVLALPNCVV